MTMWAVWEHIPFPSVIRGSRIIGKFETRTAAESALADAEHTERIWRKYGVGNNSTFTIALCDADANVTPR